MTVHGSGLLWSAKVTIPGTWGFIFFTLELMSTSSSLGLGPLATGTEMNMKTTETFDLTYILPLYVIIPNYAVYTTNDRLASSGNISFLLRDVKNPFCILG